MVTSILRKVFVTKFDIFHEKIHVGSYFELYKSQFSKPLNILINFKNGNWDQKMFNTNNQILYLSFYFYSSESHVYYLKTVEVIFDQLICDIFEGYFFLLFSSYIASKNSLPTLSVWSKSKTSLIRNFSILGIFCTPGTEFIYQNRRHILF